MGAHRQTETAGSGQIRGSLIAASAILIALACSVSPVAAADPNRLERSPLVLRLVWCDVLGKTPFPFDQMSGEVARILGGSDVEVAWRVAGADGSAEAEEILVILLDRTNPHARSSRHVMGSTPRHAERRAAWAYSSTVLLALGLQDGRALSQHEQLDFARALGRVVAHEVVHAVAPSLPHAHGGLMRACMGRSDLLRPGLMLEGAHRRVFAAELDAFSRTLGERRPSVARAPEAGPAIAAATTALPAR